MKFESLPNEIFMECFDYLNAPDIFYSFDQLNYRFSTLIRDSPLHVNFYQMKKSLFNDFCEIRLLNPKIQQKIICLQLSNKGTRDQIQSFLSLFSLDKFLCLTFRTLKILNALSKSKLKIEILTVPYFDYKSASKYGIIKITSLTRSACYLSDLFQLFKHSPMLKYLRIKELCTDSGLTDDQLNLTNANAIYLKQLILDYSKVKFELLELFLKSIPNLKIFSISAPHEIDMIDANRWQHLIESSLLHLNVFKFHFGYITDDSYNNILIKFQSFQSDFWCKQHHCHTNYEINSISASIYTISYVSNDYTLIPTMNRSCNSNEFDNVKNLSLLPRAITYDLPCYFRNVESLRLTNRYYGSDETDEYQVEIQQIGFLHMFINLSNIKSLTIEDECYMTSSLLLNILKEIPSISSLTIDKRSLISFLSNYQLNEYLNKNIKILDMWNCWFENISESNEINLFCETFSNLEQLYCCIQKLDDLLLILHKCSKLSMIHIGHINEHIQSWIKINAPTLNVYIYCI